MYRDANLIVNLEEIWTNGALLESEESVEEGAKVEIFAAEPHFSPAVSFEAAKRQRIFGWRFEVEFSPLTPWNVEKFQPEHLLDVSKLGE